MSDGGEVVGFLHGIGGQHSEAGLAAGHDIGMIAENRKGVGSEATGGHVHTKRQQFAGDFVHIGDHEQEPLRGGEGRGQRAGLQHAMHGSGDAALALHLGDGRHRAEQIRLLAGCPLIAEFGHRRRGRNRIDGDGLAELIGDGSGGFIAVLDGAELFTHNTKGY